MTGLLFVDLDHFKTVNDTLGHACGDEVLRVVAARLAASVRSGDVVCRLGGDEFVALVEPVTSERDLLERAERLIEQVCAPILVGGREVTVGASVGIAVSMDGSTDADTLLAEADTAVYRAKAAGRGRCEVFDDALRAELHSRSEVEAAIGHALAAGELELHYQPVVDVVSTATTGYEALVRWNRPGHGLVPPDAFIPIAEGSSLICDLGRWVLHEATAQLATWRAQGVGGEPGQRTHVAVNVSGRHLNDPRILQDVDDALRTSGLPAHLLVIEITETVLMDAPVAARHLASLRSTGVLISIDDFGTGYTSIGQLRQLAVDTLKIDRSLVASDDPGHRALVALTVSAAHTFGLVVVAEGVEDAGQLALLRETGCDSAQGYLFSRPLTAQAAAQAAGRRLAPTT
jgi:diguanylate cyclase (GGDEF)-like protein